jgi:hypothetical protein
MTKIIFIVKLKNDHTRINALMIESGSNEGKTSLALNTLTKNHETKINVDIDGIVAELGASGSAHNHQLSPSFTSFNLLLPLVVSRLSSIWINSG